VPDPISIGAVRRLALAAQGFGAAAAEAGSRPPGGAHPPARPAPTDFVNVLVRPLPGAILALGPYDAPHSTALFTAAARSPPAAGQVRADRSRADQQQRPQQHVDPAGMIGEMR